LKKKYDRKGNKGSPLGSLTLFFKLCIGMDMLQSVMALQIALHYTMLMQPAKHLRDVCSNAVSI